MTRRRGKLALPSLLACLFGTIHTVLPHGGSGLGGGIVDLACVFEHATSAHTGCFHRQGWSQQQGLHGGGKACELVRGKGNGDLTRGVGTACRRGRGMDSGSWSAGHRQPLADKQRLRMGMRRGSGCGIHAVNCGLSHDRTSGCGGGSSSCDRRYTGEFTLRIQAQGLERRIGWGGGRFKIERWGRGGKRRRRCGQRRAWVRLRRGRHGE